MAKKLKYRVVPVVENKGIYGVNLLYKVQRKRFFGWFDETNANISKTMMENICDRLNNAYSK